MPMPKTDDVRRDLSTRSIQLRAATLNEEQRSVEAVIATEEPTEVWDRRSGEIIDEILLVDRADLPGQLPLLANHARWSLDDVLGSIRNLRREPPAIIGRLFFAGDEASERAWQKVRQGHITDVSVGYRVLEATEIQAGQSAVVAGKTFTAGRRTMRVATNWAAKEGSLVPIGADQAAKIREDHSFQSLGVSAMDKSLRAYLESIGLNKDASEAEAKAFDAGLDAEQRAAADAAIRSPAAPPAAPPAEPPAAPPDADEAARRAIADERLRVRQITELAGEDVPETVRNQAISDGWPLPQASQAFLAAIRAVRQAGPAIHSHSVERDANVRTLGLGLVMRTRSDVERWAVRNHVANWEQLADQAERFRSLSLVDICRHAVALDGCSVPSDRNETIRAAVSGGTLSGIFTTSVNASLMAAWEEEVDTTQGWVEEVDVADFKTQTAVDYEGRAGLQILPRGTTAQHMAPSDGTVTYSIDRYAKQFVIDEQDIIDDSLDALTRMPADLGAAARRLRPDLVYSILLDNPTMGDTGELFNATALTTAGGHANLTTAVLGTTGLQAAIVAMANQYIGTGRNKIALNIRPAYLVVPQDLLFTAMGLMQSPAIIAAGLAATNAFTNFPSANVLAGMLQVRADARIGAAGVTDPKSGTAHTGLSTNWFITAQPGKTIRVAYVRGSGRAPQLRSFILDKGQWGVGWDVKMDVGAKEMAFAGLHKSTGAG